MFSIYSVSNWNCFATWIWQNMNVVKNFCPSASIKSQHQIKPTRFFIPAMASGDKLHVLWANRLQLLFQHDLHLPILSHAGGRIISGTHCRLFFHVLVWRGHYDCILMLCYFHCATLLCQHCICQNTSTMCNYPIHEWALVVISLTGCQVVALFVNLVFLGQAFTIMLVYVWSRRNPYVRMNFFGLLNFQAPYLPWVLLGFSLLLGNSIIVDLMGKWSIVLFCLSSSSKALCASFLSVEPGIAVGHIYYFLEDVFPEQPGGFQILRTPNFLWVYNWSYLLLLRMWHQSQADICRELRSLWRATFFVDSPILCGEPCDIYIHLKRLSDLPFNP